MCAMNEQVSVLSNQARQYLSRFAPEVVLLLCFAPLVWFHLGDLWDNENYQYFPFVLAAVCYLSWQKLNAGGDDSRRVARATAMRRAIRARISGAGLLLAGFLLLLVASLIWSPWVGTIGAIVAFGAFMLTSHLAPEWFLLWLLVPLPGDLDNDLTYYLQGVASRSGSVFLDFFGTDHLLTGYTIEVPGQRFLVEDACSGIHSLFVLIAFAAIYVVWQRRSVFHALLLITMTVGWALLINVIRISLVVMMPTHLGIDVSTGMPHEVLGMVLFVAALGLLFCTDLCLLFLLEPASGSRRHRRAASQQRKTRNRQETASSAAVAPVAGAEPASRSAVETPPTSEAGNAWVRWVVPGAFVLVLILQVAPILQELNLWQTADAQIQEFAFAEETMPAQIGSWKRQAYEFVERDTFDELGARSAMWTFRTEGIDAVVSFDYPFIGWHHLAYCYRATGWTTQSWQTARSDQGDGGAYSAYDVEMDLDRADGNGHLQFCEFDQSSQPLEPPQHDRYTLAYIEERALRGLLRTQNLYGAYGRRTYQFQVFCPHDQPLTEEQKDQLRQLYQQTKAVVMQQVRQQSAAAGASS